MQRVDRFVTVRRLVCILSVYIARLWYVYERHLTRVFPLPPRLNRDAMVVLLGTGDVDWWKVVGVGGGGGNAVVRMTQQSIPGVEFWCLNTDAQVKYCVLLFFTLVKWVESYIIRLKIMAAAIKLSLAEDKVGNFWKHVGNPRRALRYSALHFWVKKSEVSPNNCRDNAVLCLCIYVRRENAARGY